jgi:hypothetical protein
MNPCLPRRLMQVAALTVIAAASGLAAADAPAPERVVDLPPLNVTEPLTGPPWRYLATPGLEVLSRCTDGVTRHLVQEMHRLDQFLGVMLPGDLRVKWAVPTIVVIYSEETKPVVSSEVMAELLGDAGRETRPGGRRVRYRSLPNMRLSDKDALAFFFILDEKNFEHSKLVLTPDYVREVIEKRTPAPPPWFIAGMLALYETADFTASPVAFTPVAWLSPLETERIRNDPDYPQALLTMEELFSGTPPAPNQDTETYRRLRRAQASLFIRWGLDGKDHPRREALWKFVARASAAPATEQMFQECFGLGYVDAQERLGDYLSNAVGQGMKLTPEAGAAPAPLEPRPATDVEIARIRGDWERLEIGYVGTHYPQLTPKYVEQARRTLRRAYDHGERDPRLLAVLGLTECDAGNDAGARPFLEAAVRGGVVRPRADYELARLRYAEAQAAPAAAGGRLSAEQAASVLQPLADACRQSPPLLETYALAAEVWSRSPAVLTRRNLEVLDQGIDYFPRDARLMYQTAWLNARQGFKPEAEALIARGLKAEPDSSSQVYFEQLRAALDAPVGKSTPGPGNIP